MLIEQAVFTSVRSGQNAGYQLAAASPGVSRSAARCLAQWGPGHDSMYDPSGGAAISFCELEPGTHCIGHTSPAGAEYSGRGGQRICTQFLLVPAPALRRFANNPFRVVEALVASGRLQTPHPLPPHLETIRLLGRASPVQAANLERVNRRLGAHKLAALLKAAVEIDRLGVVSRVPADHLLAALLDLLPPAHRPPFSLTTGLKVSARRPFRIHVLPDSEAQKRLGARQLGMTPISLLADPPARFAPNRGWPALVHQLLETHRYPTLATILDHTTRTSETDLDVLAEMARDKLEHAEDVATTASLPPVR